MRLMSTNASTWFYREPEKRPYLVTERLNATFWQSRVVEFYWRCTQTEPTFLARGYSQNGEIELEWVPNDWLALRAPAEIDLQPLVDAISKRVLARPACLTYATHKGQQVYEWHTDDGDHRWTAIQGRGEFIAPRRLGVRQA